MCLLWPKGSAGSHQLLVLVCVVTPTKSFRVVCGNAHPAYLVLMRAQLHHGSCANWACLAHYSSHVERTDVLNDLLDKAQFELDDTRHAVSNAAHNFAMLKQSLVDQLAQDNKALEQAKADHLVSRESRSRGGGESLASLEASQVASKNSCARMASDHEASS